MKKKIERSAGGIVYKKEQNSLLWLVTQHSEHKGWGFPKGLIGDTVENEPVEVAALREVGEEGGIEALIMDKTPVQVAYTYSTTDTIVDKTVRYFLMQYVSGDPNDHDWEVSEAKFLPEEEVKLILTHDTDKEAFQKILEKYNQIHNAST